jgi:hypothetical protein
MRSQFEKVIRVHLYKIIIALLAVGILCCWYIYFQTKDAKYEALLAGMVTGLIVALIQYLLDWNEHAEIETIKKLGIRRILPHRDDKAYYQDLLSQATGNIDVLGVTASRFIEDFAHATRGDSQTLLEALNRGVRVRILLPKAKHLKQPDVPRAESAKTRMEQIARSHPGFEYRYFDHPPTHSLVKVDKECLFGPVFPHVNSKDSPTMHADVDSAFVAEYLRYFENEWTQASED